MNFWEEIESNLWNEGFDVGHKNDLIEWRSEKGSHSINYKNIAIDNTKLAWYQDEEYGKCWVKIRYSDGIVLNWKPISNHSDYGFQFHFIKWFGNNLIIIYGEKHAEYIIKIEHLKVDTLYRGSIDEIQIDDNLIFVKKNGEDVHIINLHSLEINQMPFDELKTTYPNADLKRYDFYFNSLYFDKDYNKN